MTINDDSRKADGFAGRTVGQLDEAHRAACYDALHIAALGDGFHVLEIPGPDGKPYRAWPGPFESHEAASLFLDSLVANAVEGNPNDACCSYGIFEFFNLAGRFLAFLEQQDGIEDARGLACCLADERPWDGVRHQSQETSDDAPF